MINIKGMLKCQEDLNAITLLDFKPQPRRFPISVCRATSTQIHYISDDLQKRHLFEVKTIHRKIKLKIMTHKESSIKKHDQFKSLINVKFIIYIVYRFLSWKLINTKFSTCSYLVKGLHIQHGLGAFHKRHSLFSKTHFVCQR